MALKLKRFLLATSSSVGAWSATIDIPEGMRLREIVADFHGDAAAGVTPDFTAMGDLTISQTGPGNSGELVNATTLACLALQMNRRGGIVDAAYAAGGACEGSIVLYYAYENGDKKNCLYFDKGMGLALRMGATGGGAAVWDTLTTEIYAVYADDETCAQLYVPHTSQTQVTLGGTNPQDVQANLCEYAMTAGSVSNPTGLALMQGDYVEDEGSWEGLKRMANAKYPIEATQATVQSVLHDEFEQPSDIFALVRPEGKLRIAGGSGTSQLFQRYVTFNADQTALCVERVHTIADAKRAALRASRQFDEKMRAMINARVRPVQVGSTVRTAERIAGKSALV